MNTAKSWICYLWLLAVDSLEELIDVASNPKLIVRSQSQSTPDLQDDGSNSRSDVIPSERTGEASRLWGLR